MTESALAHLRPPAEESKRQLVIPTGLSIFATPTVKWTFLIWWRWVRGSRSGHEDHSHASGETFSWYFMFFKRCLFTKSLHIISFFFPDFTTPTPFKRGGYDYTLCVWPTVGEAEVCRKGVGLHSCGEVRG